MRISSIADFILKTILNKRGYKYRMFQTHYEYPILKLIKRQGGYDSYSDNYYYRRFEKEFNLQTTLLTIDLEKQKIIQFVGHLPDVAYWRLNKYLYAMNETLKILKFENMLPNVRMNFYKTWRDEIKFTFDSVYDIRSHEIDKLKLIPVFEKILCIKTGDLKERISGYKWALEK